MLAALGVLSVLGVFTWRQGHVYRNLETLWRDTLAKNPSAWMAHNNLGIVLRDSGKVQEAKQHYEQALRIKPDYAEAHINLGLVLEGMGKLHEAIEHYEQALRIKPDYALAHVSLGNALLRAGNVPDAVGQYEEALRFKPDFAGAHVSLGFVLSHIGRIQEAIGHYEQALRINPDFVDAQNNLAWWLATLPQAQGGDPVRAVTLAQRACELTGNRAATCLDTLGVAYAAVGRFSDALATAESAIDLARSAGQPQLVREIEAHMQFYRVGRAAPVRPNGRLGQPSLPTTRRCSTRSPKPARSWPSCT
jgi:tetratricopeptide (TPR) repeat protein